MRNVNAKLGATMILLAMCAVPMNAQKKKAKIAEKDSLTTASVGRDADNMMLNASDESTPRFINVGLPEATGGTVVTENGMPVSYDTNALSTNKAWRQDGSFTKGASRNLAETAINLNNS